MFLECDGEGLSEGKTGEKSADISSTCISNVSSELVLTPQLTRLLPAFWVTFASAVKSHGKDGSSLILFESPNFKDTKSQLPSRVKKTVEEDLQHGYHLIISSPPQCSWPWVRSLPSLGPYLTEPPGNHHSSPTSNLFRFYSSEGTEKLCHSVHPEEWLHLPPSLPPTSI